MATQTQIVSEVKDGAQEAAGQVIPWVEKLARFGYAAKGVVYAVIGILALQLASGQGGEATGPEGALSTIGQQPFGRTPLAISVGPACLRPVALCPGRRRSRTQG